MQRVSAGGSSGAGPQHCQDGRANAGPRGPRQGLNSAKGESAEAETAAWQGGQEQRGEAGGGCPARSPGPGQTETRKRRGRFQRNCLKQKPRAGAPAHLSHGAALSRQGASSLPALPTFWRTSHDSAFDAKRSLIWHHLGALASIRHMGICP